MREATDKVLELVEEGILDRDEVIMACVKYMSEDEVRDMFRSNFYELYEETVGEDDDDEEDYEEDDGQPSEYDEWMDFDPDC